MPSPNLTAASLLKRGRPSMEMAKTLWRRHSFHLDWLKPHKFETFPEAFRKQICLMQRCRHHLSAANRYGLYLDEPGHPKYSWSFVPFVSLCTSNLGKATSSILKPAISPLAYGTSTDSTIFPTGSRALQDDYFFKSLCHYALAEHACA
jgi:hypothetical protein